MEKVLFVRCDHSRYEFIDKLARDLWITNIQQTTEVAIDLYLHTLRCVQDGYDVYTVEADRCCKATTPAIEFLRDTAHPHICRMTCAQSSALIRYEDAPKWQPKDFYISDFRLREVRVWSSKLGYDSEMTLIMEALTFLKHIVDAERHFAIVELRSPKKPRAKRLDIETWAQHVTRVTQKSRLSN